MYCRAKALLHIEENCTKRILEKFLSVQSIRSGGERKREHDEVTNESKERMQRKN